MRSPDASKARQLLGRNVRRLRQAAGLTQQQTADRAGLDLRHFQKVEAGENNATLTTIVRVAFGLNVGIAALFKAPRPRSH